MATRMIHAPRLTSRPCPPTDDYRRIDGRSGDLDADTLRRLAQRAHHYDRGVAIMAAEQLAEALELFQMEGRL